MATEGETQEQEEQQTEQAEVETGAETEQTETTETTAETTETASDEVAVTIGDAKADDDEKAPEWVREVRQRNRDLARENRELRARVGGQDKAGTLRKKPSIADHEYDAEKFEADLDRWHGEKRVFDEKEAEANRIAEAQQQSWQAKLGTYGQQKASLKVKDFEDAEAAVLESLTEVQNAIIVKGAKNAALVIYAIGSNPGKRKELAAIKDPVEFAFAVANLETQLKVTKKAPPSPERKVNGDASTTGVNNSELDRLRADAEKSGDYTKVNEYKRRSREAKAA